MPERVAGNGEILQEYRTDKEHRNQHVHELGERKPAIRDNWAAVTQYGDPDYGLPPYRTL